MSEFSILPFGSSSKISFLWRVPQFYCDKRLPHEATVMRIPQVWCVNEPAILRMPQIFIYNEASSMKLPQLASKRV